jgi:hypothetical protein
MKERRLRLLRGLDHVLIRIGRCVPNDEKSDQASAVQGLQTEAESLQRTLRTRRALIDTDDVRSGAETIYRIENALIDVCGQPTGPDLALTLIWSSRSEGQ